MSNRLVAGVIASFLILGVVGCSSDSDGGATSTTTINERTTTAAGDSSSPPSTVVTSSTSGADETGPASLDSVASSIQSVFSISRSHANCAAEKLEGEVSEQAFRAMANANPAEVPDDEAMDVYKAMGAAIAACA